MIKFITLGPAGSNHQLVTERYIDFHGLQSRAEVTFFRTFQEGAEQILKGEADFMIQCAVHPSTVETVASYFEGLFVIDTFISPSRDLAIVKNKKVDHPRKLAAMSPTLPYIDASKWEVIPEVTVMAVKEGLTSGRYEAGICYTSLAEEHPDRFAIAEYIGSVDDAWIVYGRNKVTGDKLLAWPNSPAAAQYREMV